MYTDVITVLGLGIFLGLEHALDGDHIAAISTLVSKHKNFRKASILGVFWGLGHTTTLLIAGIFVLFLKIAIPEKIALSLEFVVGIMIVILGFSVVRDVIFSKKHMHKHSHNGHTHLHVHSHKQTSDHVHYHKPFIVGLIHGLAGSAALMLLVLSTVESRLLGLLFIMIFGIGSIIGMSIVSGAISLPFIFSSQKELTNRRIRYIAGSFSMLFGLMIMLEVIFLM